MLDSQLVYDNSDRYRRGREGGQTYVYESNHIQQNDDNEKIFMKDIQKILNCLGYNQNIYEKIEPILRKIEKEQNCISPICLILAMKFTLKLEDYSLLNYPKDCMQDYLKKEWEIIDAMISKQGKKYFENQFSNKKFQEEDFIRYKIYKSKVYPSCNINRYIAIWKREVFLHNYLVRKKNMESRKNRENGMIRKNFDEMIMKRNEKLFTDKIDSLYHERIYQVRAENGRNACWINSVLFIFLSHPLTRRIILCNKFVGKENQPFVEKLTMKKWDDILYSFFYKIFKENCYDIVNYGDYGNPHTILIWLIDDLVAKEEIHMDLDFDVTINSFDKFQSKIQNDHLYGIIKGTSRITTGDMNMEYNSEHFISFVKKNEHWVHFDALKGGTVDGELDEKNIFQMADDDVEFGSCPYYFLYLY